MSSSAGDAKLAALAKANRVLVDQLTRDAARVPDPADIILGGNATGMVSLPQRSPCSRTLLMNHSYTVTTASSSSAYAPAPNHAWTPFELRKTLMIPEELFSDFERQS